MSNSFIYIIYFLPNFFLLKILKLVLFSIYLLPYMYLHLKIFGLGENYYSGPQAFMKSILDIQNLGKAFSIINFG